MEQPDSFCTERGSRASESAAASPAPRKARPILVADLFCGAGGSSTGAAQAIAQLGRRMDLVCVNHWDRAIETHKRMHPEARHYCQDVARALVGAALWDMEA